MVDLSQAFPILVSWPVLYLPLHTSRPFLIPLVTLGSLLSPRYLIPRHFSIPSHSPSSRFRPEGAAEPARRGEWDGDGWRMEWGAAEPRVSMSVGSSSLLSSLAPVGFTSLASGGMEWSVERRRTRNTTRQNDRRWRARMNRPGETEAGWSVSSLSLFTFPSRSPLCYSRRSCRHSLLTSLTHPSLILSLPSPYHIRRETEVNEERSGKEKDRNDNMISGSKFQDS